jgi:DNA modification methylase
VISLLQSDARKMPLADESVQCIVTSPPYWGLRKYAGEQEVVWDGLLECEHEWSTSTRKGGGKSNGKERWNHTGHGKHGHATSSTNLCDMCGAWRGAYGLEPTLKLYIQHTVEILRECRRVLRPDGVLFWNIGDSYAAAKGYGGDLKISDLQSSNKGSLRGKDNPLPQRTPQDGLKPKDLCLIPQRVAIAAQADGWWVRSMIVWAKPNPMPESVTDRPSDAYEHILMFTKSERYFWDADAVREKAVAGWNGSSFTDERDRQVYANLEKGPRNEFGYAPKGTHPRGTGDGGPKAQQRGSYEGWTDGTREVLGFRNLRNVWMFATQPYAGAHFATFPEELPRRCILAGTSAKGACAQCGAPWERVLRSEHGKSWHPHENDEVRGNRSDDGLRGQDFYANYQPPETIGWTPTCRCKGQRGQTVPCVVLDPFGGSGTTGRVAIALRRRAVLVDIAYDAEYRTLAEARTSGVDVELPFL